MQWRRTGDTGLRLAATPGTVQWWAKLGFIAALAAGVAAPITGLAGLDPLEWLARDALRVAGTVIAVVGVLATAVAQVQMGASWRIGVNPAERTGLVTSGIFAVVRNPIFTAMLIAAIGFTLMVGNVVALLGLAALIGALEVQVRAVEEPYCGRLTGRRSITTRRRPGGSSLRSDEAPEPDSAPELMDATLAADGLWGGHDGLVLVRLDAVELPGRDIGSPGSTERLENVHVGVQRGRDPYGLVPADAAEVTWEFEVTTPVARDGGLDFGGPFTHGRRGDRFVYLTWGTVDDASTFSMFRRAKLHFADIDGDVLARAATGDLPLHGVVILTDECGLPRCARVRPPTVTWSCGTRGSG